MKSSGSVLLGSQEPRLLVRPTGAVSSAGVEAVELAASAGLILDPWQELCLDVGCAEDRSGRWAAFEVGIGVPRQNGKNAILEARELAGLFLFGEELLIHSAHQYATAKEAFYRMRALIEGAPDLLSKVAQFYASSLEFSVKLKTGQRLRYLARSGGGGRGFSGDLIVLDEAFQLGAKEMGALLPTLSARPNPQVWYTSSAPMSTSTQLHAVRKRALSGDAQALAWLEWSNDEDADPDDPAAWAISNPALGRRITADYIAKERQAMILIPGEFARERLGIPDPEPVQAGSGAVPLDAWEAARDPKSGIEGRVILAVEVSEDRLWSSIGVAGYRADGVPHVEVIEHKAGTHWVRARLLELQAAQPVDVTVVDPRSPAGSLIPDLEAHDVKLHTVAPLDTATACGLIVDACTLRDASDTRWTPAVRHIGQPMLSNAVATAATRPVSGAKAWRRATEPAENSPLLAVTLAFGHLVTTREHKRKALVAH